MPYFRTMAAVHIQHSPDLSTWDQNLARPSGVVGAIVLISNSNQFGRGPGLLTQSRGFYMPNFTIYWEL